MTMMMILRRRTISTLRQTIKLLNHPKTTNYKCITKRMYNFASTPYESCFSSIRHLKVPTHAALQQNTLKAMANHVASDWYANPVATILNGEVDAAGEEAGNSSKAVLSDTLDAFGNVNGKILYANRSLVDAIIAHVQRYNSNNSAAKYKNQVRLIERELLDVDNEANYVGQLIANQAVDFWKQDGVTEIEEAIMANEIERRMNDLLLKDEQEMNKVEIHRDVAFVGCVSNFGNFLDLCRKVLRNIEVGVPVVVFSRSNTTQHSFRWSHMLMQLMKKYSVDVGLLTYASVTIDEALRIMHSSSNSPMYITCSRELAGTIKKQHPNLISSTGGPNTLVSTELTPTIEQAIRDSALIENSGQCTALRHVVVPCTDQEVSHVFGNIPIVSSPQEALRQGQFAGLFESEHFAPIESPDIPVEYSKQPEHDVYYRICDDLPPDGVNEYWRKVVVDVTNGPTIDVNELAGWLVRNQPISLAINGDWVMARDLFDKTALVVYTVGTLENPALTCQARPQEKEIFGEFPIRRDLSLYTKYPVIVPSSTPAYNSSYTIEYLNSISDMTTLDQKLQYIKPLLEALENKSVRGFCCELANYIADAAGPKAELGDGRTVLWGLQRPPLNGTMSVIRCGRRTTLDNMLSAAIPFIITNAREQLEISIDDENATGLESILGSFDPSLFTIIMENEKHFETRTFKGMGANDNFFNVMDVDSFGDNDETVFPLVSQFVSLFLPMGHIKSTTKRDHEFISFFQNSEKWLRLH